MVGCFGRAKDGQTIRLDLDNELEGAATPFHSHCRADRRTDAQWFSRDHIRKIMGSPSGSTYSKAELKGLEDKAKSDQETANALAPTERKEGESQDGSKVEGLTRVPPMTASAGNLIRLWASGGLDLVSKL